MKEFNTTAVCIPSKHYMVDLSDRIREIRKLVDAGKYFTINRARQYGKTTTIDALCRNLADQYIVISLDFQDIGGESFSSEDAFCRAFSRIMLDAAEYESLEIPEPIHRDFKELAGRPTSDVKMDELFRIFRNWFRGAEKPLILIIDEVDTAVDNQVFLDFLAQLRSLYLKREKNTRVKTFQSVILSGVADIKHLRRGIRNEDQHKVNSPWNTREGNEPYECSHSYGDCSRDHMAKPYDIAADFDVDMSLSEAGIKGMLDEYETDHHTGMNTADMAREIRAYTNGYPFLVSRICQLIDQEVCGVKGSADGWTRNGIDEAVKMILAENNTLFQSITGKLTNYPELKASLRSILMQGTRLTYNPDQEDIAQMEMYGLIRNDHNTVRIANRIFETRLYNLFLSEEELKNNVFAREGELAKNMFVKDGRLDMRLILERFIVTYTQVCGPLRERFREKDGREQFLLYLKPIINGTGNYYIEAQTRDQTRTDVIVDYLGQQYIIELKIWRGERYNAEGEKQISNYLDYWNLDIGYMLSFNFNKKKKTGVERVQIGDKTLYEGTV